MENKKFLGIFISMKASLSETRQSSCSDGNMETTSSTDDAADSNTTQCYDITKDRNSHGSSEVDTASAMDNYEDFHTVPSSENLEGEEQTACHICLGDYECGEEVCLLQNPYCTHVFHKECISEWLLKHNECPCCRRYFLGVDEVKTKEENVSEIHGDSELTQAADIEAVAMEEVLEQ